MSVRGRSADYSLFQIHGLGGPRTKWQKIRPTKIRLARSHKNPVLSRSKDWSNPFSAQNSCTHTARRALSRLRQYARQRQPSRESHCRHRRSRHRRGRLQPCSAISNLKLIFARSSSSSVWLPAPLRAQMRGVPSGILPTRQRAAFELAIALAVAVSLCAALAVYAFRFLSLPYPQDD
jgi:hypothetical protein